MVIGLTGTVVALVGLYLIALGAWGIRRGVLGAVIAVTAVVAVGALALRWVRTELWGTNGAPRTGGSRATSCPGCATTGGPGWPCWAAPSCSLAAQPAAPQPGTP